MSDRSELLHDFSDAAAWLERVAPPVEFCSLRLLEERGETVRVQRGVPLPAGFHSARGAMLSVIDQGGIGYAATSDLSFGGLYQAAREAAKWAKLSRGRTVTDFSTLDRPQESGEYRTPVTIPWESVSLPEKIDRLLGIDEVLGADSRIVDRQINLQ